MKKLVIVMALVIAMSAVALAKVNISGELITQWRAQQRDQRTGAVAAVGATGNNETDPKKVYEVPMLKLILDAQVSDRVMAYGEIDFSAATRGGAQAMTSDAVQAWAQVSFGKERAPHITEARSNRLFPARLLSFRMGKFKRPFGAEAWYAGEKTTTSNDEVFANRSIVADANGMMSDTDVTLTDPRNVKSIVTGINNNEIVGAMISGDLDMLKYGVYVANTTLRSIAEIGTPVYSSQQGNKNAKAYGVTLRAKPLKDLVLGFDYEMGQYGRVADTLANSNTPEIKTRRMNAWNINAQYDVMNQFLIRGEYAAIKHNDYLPGDTVGRSYTDVGWGSGNTQSKYVYYILEGTYYGIKNWQFGVRVSDINTKNLATENHAGYSRLRQYQYAVQYNISANAVIKGEFAQRKTNTANNPTGADGSAGGASYSDPADHVYTVQMAVKF